MMNAKANPRRGGEQVADWRDRLVGEAGVNDFGQVYGGVMMAAPVAGSMTYTSDTLGLRG